MMIVNSTVKKFIGRKGIVVNETKNTLELVMEEGDIPNEEERSRGETNVEEGDAGGAHVHVGDSGSGTNTSSRNGTVNSEVGGHMGHKGGNGTYVTLLVLLAHLSCGYCVLQKSLRYRHRLQAQQHPRDGIGTSGTRTGAGLRHMHMQMAIRISHLESW